MAAANADLELTEDEVKEAFDSMTASIADAKPQPLPEPPPLAPARDHPLGTELGEAELVGVYVDGSPEWHAARRAGIGGSEIATILGINNFMSPYYLWHLKAGIFSDEDQESEVLEWGHRLEDSVAQKFADRHPDCTLFYGGSWRHKERKRDLCNPDRLYVDEDGVIRILEVKTSMYGTGWEMGRVPEKYVAQVRWYLGVLGLTEATIIVLISLGDYREFTINVDPSVPIEKVYGGSQAPSKYRSEINVPVMRAAADNFLQSVQDGRVPPVDAGKDTYELLRKQNPSLEKGAKVELPVVIGTMLAEARFNMSKAEEDLQEARNHVMAHMGTAQYAFYNKEKVATRISKSGNCPYLKLA